MNIILNLESSQLTIPCPDPQGFLQSLDHYFYLFRSLIPLEPQPGRTTFDLFFKLKRDLLLSLKD
jgi:hypothetical protein